MVGLPKVSVIIPTHNRARVIRRSVESALRQTHQDFEILIVDDGSTDETLDVVKPLLRDQQVRYVRHEEQKGQNAALNTGIRNSNGDYVAFLDSDDMWVPQKLELQLRALITAPAKSVALTAMWRVAENAPAEKYLKKYNGYVFPKMLAGEGPSYCCMLVPRECLKKIGFLDESTLRDTDWDTCIALSRHYEFVTLEEPCTIVFTDEPDSMTSDILGRAFAYQHIVEKNQSDMLRFVGKRGLAWHHTRIAFLFARAGEFNRYRAHMLQAFRLDAKDPQTFLLAFSTLFGMRAFQLVRGVGPSVKNGLRKLTII